MFKQIFENKIDKLTNFNNAGKIATDLFDKFRNSLDLSDSGPPPSSTVTSPSIPKKSNSHLSNSNSSLVDTNSSVTTNDESNSSYHHLNNNNINRHTNNSSSSSSSNHNYNNNNFKFNDENGHDPFDESTVKSTPTRKITSPESVEPNTSVNETRNHRVLTRQSTDLTCKFPLKPFQRINSETVEIPGLNVKVVRYRVEDDLGKIDPHMYIKNNSTGADGLLMNSTSKGKIYFSLHYNEEIKSLSLTINKAEIYAHPQFSQSSSLINNSNNKKFEFTDDMISSANKPDTYVKIQLYPGKKHKYQTRVQKKTCAPAFEETFFFSIPFQDLSTKSVNLTVLDFGRFTKNSLIGSVRLNDLHMIKGLKSSEVEFALNLLPLSEEELELGELTLSLCYLPAAGRLTVTIVKASNLKAMDINGKSDPYVKVTLVSKGKRIKKKKTSVMKNTLNPVYNESIIFEVPQDQIEHIDMIVKVIDYDRVGSNELIGCIGIGPSFEGLGKDHYYRMLENSRKPMIQSYFLRDQSFLRECLPANILNVLKNQESLESKSDQ